MELKALILLSIGVTFVAADFWSDLRTFGFVIGIYTNAVVQVIKEKTGIAKSPEAALGKHFLERLLLKKFSGELTKEEIKKITVHSRCVKRDEASFDNQPLIYSSYVPRNNELTRIKDYASEAKLSDPSLAGGAYIWGMGDLKDKHLFEFTGNHCINGLFFPRRRFSQSSTMEQAYYYVRLTDDLFWDLRKIGMYNEHYKCYMAKNDTVLSWDLKQANGCIEKNYNQPGDFSPCMRLHARPRQRINPETGIINEAQKVLMMSPTNMATNCDDSKLLQVVTAKTCEEIASLSDIPFINDEGVCKALQKTQEIAKQAAVNVIIEQNYS